MTAEKIRDLSWAICGICAEEACGLGFSPDGIKKIMWVCEECRGMAKNVYSIDDSKRSKFDRDARDKAGEVGGEYLEGLGKFSLAELTPDEWTRFLDTLFRVKAAELRRLNEDCCPPF